ncbi:MAG: alpha/beta hydrolase, partial [Planctomycetota bacterium]|nr:alpha/beta hydrolase [Planctomycetota bacterium]
MPETPHIQRFFVENSYQVGEVTLRVASSPAGDPPLVLLHGVTRRWQTFLPVAAQLTTRFRLHAVDLRGHGGSTPGAAYRTVDYVDDIVNLLRDHLREPVVLYGHSLGSMVAAAVAAKAPQAVRALILEDPPFHTMGDRIRQTRLHSYFQAVYDLVHAKLSFAELLRRLPEIRMVDPQTNAVQRLGDVRDAVFLRFTAQSLTQLDPRVMEP